MSTPAGYFDEQGNFIPGSFADQLDLPGPIANAGDPAQLARDVAAQKKKASAGGRESGNLTAQIKKLQAQAGKKGISAAQKKALNTRISALQKQVTKQQSIVTNANTQITTLQNKYFEVTGQYEKLLTGADRDAYAALRSLFNGYGLGSLAPKIYEYAKNGYGADVISLLLQDTKEYKTRFAGNEIRAKAGLPVLSPAEYLQTEQAYRQILQDAGLPKGFYDSPTDFTKWIAGDTSPTEVKGRVDLAVQKTMQASEFDKQALKQLYGVDDSYILAYFVDSTTALPLLQKQAAAATFGGEALKRGLGLSGNLEDMVNAGLSQSAVSQGFQAVAEALPNISAIAARYGETFTQEELERDLILGNQLGGVQQATALEEAPTNKRKRLASQERALFGGYGGSTPGGLSTGFQQT